MAWLNATPQFSAPDGGYVALRHPVPLSKNMLRFGGGSYFFYRLVTQFCRMVALAVLATVLFCHVAVVVGVLPEEKVIGVDAVAHVASMANENVVRDCADEYLVRNAVGAFVAAVFPDEAIARIIFRTLPKPASANADFEASAKPSGNRRSRAGELRQRIRSDGPHVVVSAKPSGYSFLLAELAVDLHGYGKYTVKGAF